MPVNLSFFIVTYFIRFGLFFMYIFPNDRYLFFVFPTYPVADNSHSPNLRILLLPDRIMAEFAEFFRQVDRTRKRNTASYATTKELPCCAKNKSSSCLP